MNEIISDTITGLM